MTYFKLPIDYNSIPYNEKWKVREQYIKEQGGLCFYCGNDLTKLPNKNITDKLINWDLFPKEFLKHPIHLQHCHKTGFTEGAVHAYCNAVMWQYENR